MNLHIIVENRNPKVLHTRFPQLTWAHTIEKADCSLFNHRWKDHLAASLAQGPSSSSLTASADGGWKTLDILLLSLSRYSVTCHLLVSA